MRMNLLRGTCVLLSVLLPLFVLGGCVHAPRAGSATAAMPQEAREAGLVDVADFVADAQFDIRYAGHDNFVGVPVDGYAAPRCWLHRPAAQALAQVADELRAQGLRLRIFDCYRPARAVAHFMRWAKDLEDVRTKPAYYPNLDKHELVGEYIAERSGHSRAATIDLTVMQCTTAGNACRELDMGTPFDFFDTLANTDDPRMSPQQRCNRDLLRDAMQRHGFANYAMEWWHFTFKPEPTPQTHFDIPLR
ncbi:M15 family metallopeptidase [Luteimonas sp. e5]